MKERTKNKRTGALVLLVTGLFGLVAASGCLNGTGLGDGKDANQAPHAVLKANETKAWNGDALTFDGTGSNDKDGNITEWRFDYGDGTHETVNSKDAAKTRHAYVRGGAYSVTLTVVDNGGKQSGALTDTATQLVGINERMKLGGTVAATPAGNETSTLKVPFTTKNGIDRVDTNTTLRSLLVAGQSQIDVRLLDAKNQTLAEKNVTIDAGKMTNVTLEAPFTQNGTGYIEFVAVSGSASINGELREYYADRMA